MLRPGDIVRVVPNDENDPEAQKAKGMIFKVSRIRAAIGGLQLVYVNGMSADFHRHVFRECDLKLEKQS